MGFREDLMRRIEKKRVEIEVFESQLATSRTYLQALEDMYKMASKEPSGSPTETSRRAGRTSSSTPSFRAGSLTGSVYNALKDAGHPLHVNALLEAVGRDVTRAEKSAVSGTLAAYVKKGDIFTRPAPNTFGLTEFVTADASEPTTPPPGFGKL